MINNREDICAGDNVIDTDMMSTVKHAIEEQTLDGIDLDELLKKLLPESSERYKVISRIAKGGMGVVTSVKDRSLARVVAMKKMNDSGGDLEAILSFIEEARINARLEHPNIIPIHDIGLSPENTPYYSMRLIQGESLKAIISKLQKNDPDACHTYNLTVLLQIFLKVCESISYSHSKRVLHLDIKPENIMIGEYGEVLVTDWGISREIGADHPISHKSEDVHTLDAMATINISNILGGTTSNDCIMGTPMYMAPEQITEMPESFDGRADVYALGSTLYTILTYQCPFNINNLKELLNQKSAGKYTLFRQGRCNTIIPPELEAIVVKAMQHDKADRYQSVKELIDDINAFLQNRAVSVHKDSFFKRVQRFYREHTTVCMSMLITVVFSLCIAVGLHRYNSQIKLRRQIVFGKEFSGSETVIPEFSFYSFQGESVFTPDKKSSTSGAKIPYYFNGSQRLWFNTSVTGNVRVDVEFSWSSDTIDGFKLGINADYSYSAAEQSKGEVYTAQFGGWGGGICRVTRDTLKFDSSNFFNATHIPMHKGVLYRGTIEHLDGLIKLYLDDKLILEYRDPVPLNSPENGGIFLESWSDSLVMHSIKILKLQDPVLISPVKTGDALLHSGNSEKALKTYLSIYSSYDERSIKEEALFKAALICFDQKDYEKFDEIMSKYSSEFDTAEYLDKLIYLKTGVLWEQGKYSQAIAFIYKINDTRSRVGALGMLLDLCRKKSMQSAAPILLKEISKQPYFWVLDLSGCKLIDLGQLEQANCYRLDLSYNRLNSLSPLATMSELRQLLVGYNSIDDLSPLENLQLENLSLAKNPLSDISPLSNMKSLKELRLDGTQISDLLALAPLSLRKLNVNDTAVKTLRDINVTELTSLDICDNRISDITPLSLARELKLLRMFNARCESIAAIRDCPLEFLSLSPADGKFICDLEVIAGLPLKTLSIRDLTQKYDISFVRKSKTLTSLTMFNCAITSIKKLIGGAVFEKNLNFLNIQGNSIQDLEYLAGVNLEELKITVDGKQSLNFIAEMKSLLKLTINDTRYTYSEVQQLKQRIRESTQPVFFSK